MTDWMNRPRALAEFERIDKRMDAMDKRMATIETALSELTGKLEDAVARLFPAPLEVQTDSEGRRIGGPDLPQDSIPAKDRDDPEAVHLFRALALPGLPAELWCGFTQTHATRSGTVPEETTCRVCMEAWLSAVKVRGSAQRPKAPEAVHLFGPGGTLFCGIADDSILHTTVLAGVTCKACLKASMAAGMAAAKTPLLPLPSHKMEPDGTV